MAAAAAVLVATAVLACTATGRERFTFAKSACDAIDPESEVYRSSPQLQELCARAETINPNASCLVDCDVASLCGNPSVGACRRPRYSPLLCRVTAEYYGAGTERAELPEVYRLRRGICLSVASDGGAIQNTALRMAMLRFPDSIAVVGSDFGSESEFHDTWSVTLSDHRDQDGEVALPLRTADYTAAAAEAARGQGVAARISSAVTHESCVSPGGHDTSYRTEPMPLQMLMARLRDHENQPPLIHVTARFTMPETSRLSFGGMVYNAYTAGQSRTVSPVSGKRISVRTEVWLMVAVSPKESAVTEIREALTGSDGTLHVSRTRAAGGAAVRQLEGGTPADPLVAYAGEPPQLWLGMRDACLDLMPPA